MKSFDKSLVSVGLGGFPLDTIDKRPLERMFGMPPFSVLDCRSGSWIKRKNQWVSAYKLFGEVGRQVDDNSKGVSYGKTLDSFGGELRKTYNAKLYEGTQQDFEKKVKIKKGVSKTSNTGTSVFDPVLTELMYTWFNKANGSVLDPFAGGTTRGCVAAVGGYSYTGLDIREEQICANYNQVVDTSMDTSKIKWLLGNSSNLDTVLPQGEQYDMLFSCPPYYDLEVYSDSAGDGSTTTSYADFLEWYRHIYCQAVRRIRNERFVVTVVGEIRDAATGSYRNFVGDTVQMFLDLGLHYYNEIILVTRTGSLPLRTGRQFRASRKIGKTHQNVLVFFKGDLAKLNDTFTDTDLGTENNQCDW